MMMRRLIAAVLAAGWVSAAVAADEPPASKPAPLPSLALDSQTPDESIWHGFYVGTDIYGVARKGSKGFIGGDVTAGYDRIFANNIILGVNVATGVAPGFFSLGPIRGYDFASVGTKVGYQMGRWTPYVIGDLVMAKPNSRLGGSFSGLDTANDLFNSPDKLAVGGRVGAGFDYALTNNVTLGFSVSAAKGADAVFP